MYYVFDELYLDSIMNIFGIYSRGCLDGYVYDEFEVDFSSRRFYVVVDNFRGMWFSVGRCR